MKKYLLLPLLLLCRFVTAQQSEGILSFRSDIHIDTSGLVKVTETIRVFAHGDKIRRGIFRTLPYYRKDKYGQKQRVDVKLTNVLKDGEAESHYIENKNGSLVVYIGSQGVYLEDGVYTYQISYESRGHVGFFKDYDELYWNVTGNEWEFPIDTVEAVVRLPEGASIRQMACYTGSMGSKARDCNASADMQGNALFSAQGLGVFEGLTVAVGWPPGLVKRPPPPGLGQQVWYFKNYLLALAGVVYLFCFYYKRWEKYGKDAAESLIVPGFKPPRGWSPAKLRYAYKRKIDSKVFSVSIIHMAVKKLLFIRQTHGKAGTFTLERSEGNVSELAQEEREVYNQLFLQHDKLTISQHNYGRFNEARQELEKELKAAFEVKEHYRSNGRQLWQASWRTFLILFGFLFMAEEASISILMLMGLLFWVISAGIFAAGVKSLRDRSFIIGFFLLFFSLPFLGATTFMLIKGVHSFSFLSLVFSILIVAGFISFVLLIPAYTSQGSVLKAEIKGFRLYLATAEEHRLNMLMPPAHTPELFERLLPYALALDLENEWAKKFETVLRKAEYDPGWYGGDRFTSGILAGAMAKDLDSSLQRAHTRVASGIRSNGSSGTSGSAGSSSWSSGSSGGGSSGGGGGGGGVGGW